MDDALYKYGVINEKQIRVSVENWMDIWSWRECKIKPSYWYKLKVTIETTQKGYKKYRVTIKCNKYGLSRVIYKLYNEDWDISDNSSDNFIDHINNNSLDNRIENLRILSNLHNCWNKKNVRGYTLVKKSGKYRAVLRCNGKYYYGCLRDAPEEARADYLLLKAEHHILPE